MTAAEKVRRHGPGCSQKASQPGVSSSSTGPPSSSMARRAASSSPSTAAGRQGPGKGPAVQYGLGGLAMQGLCRTVRAVGKGQQLCVHGSVLRQQEQGQGIFAPDASRQGVPVQTVQQDHAALGQFARQAREIGSRKGKGIFHTGQLQGHQHFGRGLTAKTESPCQRDTARMAGMRAAARRAGERSEAGKATMAKGRRGRP